MFPEMTTSSEAILSDEAGTEDMNDEDEDDGVDGE